MKTDSDFMVKSKTVSLAVLISMLLLAMLSFGTLNAQAQETADLTVLSSMGGTTNPAAGNYTYDDGKTITITATADDNGFFFAHWILTADEGSRTSLDNPLSLPAIGGEQYTIQPVFDVITPVGVTILPTDLSTFAIVVVLPGSGGTTTPAAGTYALADATNLDLTATPNSGWTFSHWVISGNTDVSHGGAPVDLEPTDNPYNVDHGYGETYYYQPVFTLTSNPTPSPTIPEFSTIAILLLIAAIVPVVIFTRRNKKP